MADHPARTWSPAHDAAIVLHVSGKSDQEIAELLDQPLGWVHSVLDSDRALEACMEFERNVVDSVASRAAEVQSRLGAYAGEALDILVELLRMSTDEKMRFKAATAILDRAGFTAVQRSIVTNAELPKEVLDRMEEATRDLQAVEAEYTLLPGGPADA